MTKGHAIQPDSNAMLEFKPYYKLNYALGSFNDTSNPGAPSATYFNRKISTRVVSDFGGFNVNFPPNPDDVAGTRNIDRKKNRVTKSSENVLYSSGGHRGKFFITLIIDFGLKVDLKLFRDRRRIDIPLVNVRQSGPVEDQ